MTEQTSSESVDDKVKRWLCEQGYPTEFRTADICRRHGFRVWQGFHVRDDESSQPREIDVVASFDHRSRDCLIRIEHVFECKWSKDKPWIVFTSPNSRMAPSACAAQTIGNLLGSAAIWAISGDAAVNSLDHFFAPNRPGFGGRQAFTKNHDYFYSAVAAVAELSFLLVNRGARIARPYQDMPETAFLAFPVVVVEGQLYEAHFDGDKNDICLERRSRVRCHWQGAAAWDLHTSIDIVTLDHLDEFVSARSNETELLAKQLNEAVLNIGECFRKKTLKPLRVTPGPRGMVGLPPLLVDLRMLDGVKDAMRKRKRVPRKAKSR